MVYIPEKSSEVARKGNRPELSLAGTADTSKPGSTAALCALCCLLVRTSSLLILSIGVRLADWTCELLVTDYLGSERMKRRREKERQRKLNSPNQFQGPVTYRWPTCHQS